MLLSVLVSITFEGPGSSSLTVAGADTAVASAASVCGACDSGYSSLSLLQRTIVILCSLSDCSDGGVQVSNRGFG